MGRARLNGQSGGAKINGIVKEYIVQAGNTISAGDFVQFVDGLITLKQESVFESGYVDKIKVKQITTNKVLVMYESSSTIKAVVITVNGETLVVGDSYYVSANYSNFNINYYDFDRLKLEVKTDDVECKVFLTYAKSTENNTLYGAILTVTGSTIAFASSQPVLENGISNAYYFTAIHILLMRDNQFVITYYDSGNSAYRIRAVYADETVKNMFAYATFTQHSDSGITLIRVSATSLFAMTTDNSTNCYVWMLTYSGNTQLGMNGNTPITLANNASKSNAVMVRATEFVGVFCGQLITLRYTGVFVKSPSYSFSYYADSCRDQLIYIGDGKYYFLYDTGEGNTGNGKYMVLKKNADDNFDLLQQGFMNESNKIQYHQLVGLSNDLFLNIYTDVGNSYRGTARISKLPIELAKSADKKTINGISKTNTIAGEIAKVITL